MCMAFCRTIIISGGGGGMPCMHVLVCMCVFVLCMWYVCMYVCMYVQVHEE